MKNFDENELIDKAMAGRLSNEEQRLWDALLAQRPDLQAELQIGQALRAMPKPPTVSTNFTALVLQEINKAEPQRAAPSWADWFRWPRLARWAGVAIVAVGVAVGVTQQQRQKREVAATVQNLTHGLHVVAAEPEVRPETVVALMQDFEAIRSLPGRTNYVDYELLTAFNE